MSMRCDIPANEKDRLKALHNYFILDTPPEKAFDRLTKLAATTCEVPIALVSLIDKDRQWFKSKVGVDLEETHRNDSFCKYALMENELLEVEDATTDDRFKNNPMVVGGPKIRFYAGCPLIDADGYALGTICVLDKKPKKLSESQKEVLKVLAEEIVDQIVARKKKSELDNYERLFQLSIDLICVAGTDGFFKKVNPTFTSVLGWEEDELLGESFYKFIHPDDLQVTKDEIAKLASGINTLNFTHRFRIKSGQYKDLQWVASPELSTGKLYAIARDITDKNKMDDEIKIERQRFDQIIKGTDAGSWEWNIHSGETILNERWAEIIGYTLEELEPISIDTWLKFIHPDDQKRSEEKLEAHLGGKTDFYECEMRMQHKNGSWVWVLNKGKAIKLDNQTLWVSGSALEITDRKNNEMQLQHYKELLERTNHVARIGFWEVDLETNLPVWSTVTREIHEVDDDFEPTMESAVSFYQGKSKDKILNSVNEAIENGRSFDLEVQISTARGNSRWVRAIGLPQFEDGKCMKLYGMFQDIDIDKAKEQQLLVSEERFKGAFEHSANGIALIGINGSWLKVNQSLCKMLGYGNAELQSKSLKEITHPDDHKIDTSQIADLFAGKQDNYQIEKRYYRKDGELLWGLISVSLIRDSLGNPLHFVSQINDITDRKNAEKSALYAKEHAEAASKAKSEFLANMSHEIRTPLNSVIGFSELLMKSELNSSQKQYMQAVHQSANSLLDLINDILDFSKIEAGKLEISVEKTDLWELSAQVAEIVKYKADEQGLELLLHISPELPRFVWVDPVRIRQILINLLGNASKFTHQGEIELRIKCTANPCTNGEVNIEFSVRDTGIGISKEKQKQIFEAFGQEDSSTTRKYGGTGLGLTISNKLLSLMGSQLQLESESGKGSRFFFNICVNSENSDLSEWDTLKAIKKVLVVDDNQNNSFILKEMLSLRSIESDIADNGISALEKIKTNNDYDLAIIDFNMPFMDGIEVIRQIRNVLQLTEGELPIILLHSSSEETTIQKHCKELNVHSQLSKPITIQQLFNTITNIKSTNTDSSKISIPEKVENDTTVYNILIVDDVPFNILLAKNMVKEVLPNANILEAKNGREAVEQFSIHSPDLILMDIQMPEVSGYEATQQIREKETGNNVVIIALTAGTVKGEYERCIEAGMDDYMSKPFVLESLEQKFNEWLLNENNEPENMEVKKPRLKHVDHFDYEGFKDKTGFDDATATELVEELLLQLEDSLKSLNTAFLQQDIVSIKKIGHKIKGSTSSASMPKLAVLAAFLEDQSVFDINNINDTITALSREINNVSEVLETVKLK
ncbi:PAS domain S-box protein [Porifericola rhodea]|uniref:PAS domain S-box protein n=1 Tax=Porifericola rhodea TaxID=930972 RepID=UPI00266645B7|nr:PAS domain S-box protein [Porifericola rhodea]WKN31481.1 PAS domain S-box protein [Porifericola rhodea]